MNRAVGTFVLLLASTARGADIDSALASHGEAIVFILPATGDATQRFDAPMQIIGDRATATLHTPGGATLSIVDEWTSNPAETWTRHLKRTVTVQESGTDRAFGTGLEIDAPISLHALADADVFIPGMWYGTEANTPSSSLIHDVGQNDFLLREDRMALPLVSLRDRNSGQTITITHEQPDGATIRADDNINRVIDARLQFASLGLRRDGQQLKLAFRFPGTEGEQTSIFGFKPERRSAERMHPMKKGATQHYEVSIRIATEPNFPAQMRDAWLGAFGRAHPKLVSSNADTVYKSSIAVLDHYAFDRGNVSGIPFSVKLPGGDVPDHSLQMGFVGQQLSCASYLIDEGFRSKEMQLIGKGERICDFWSRESLSKQGVPRTWFDVDPQPHWRDYHTFLRVATDGASGLLRAWQIEREGGRAKSEWLAFCRAVGDWLLKIQNADGSFFREWTLDNKPVSRSVTNTLHPVRFLIDLSCATNDPRYRAAAVRAASFSIAHNVDGRTYVGGTVDNPDVLDKEAGWIAFDSYLALYDITREKKWLDAAVDAASFTETWMYAWNVPMPLDAEHLMMPKLKTTAGAAGLIAAGHSGSDLFLAYASLSYLRLSIYTGDAHFAEIARLLQNNTAQLVEVDGSLGYAQRGLCVEAFTLAVNRGHSVGTWLPWCTSAILEPMERGREIFSMLDIDSIAKLPIDEKRRRNDAFAKCRGFTKP